MPDGRLVAVTPEVRSDRWWWANWDLFSRGTESEGLAVFYVTTLQGCETGTPRRHCKPERKRPSECKRYLGWVHLGVGDDGWRCREGWWTEIAEA